MLPGNLLRQLQKVLCFIACEERMIFVFGYIAVGVVAYLIGAFVSYKICDPMQYWESGDNSAKDYYSGSFDRGYNAAKDIYSDWDRGFDEGWDACSRKVLEICEEYKKGG